VSKFVEISTQTRIDRNSDVLAPPTLIAIRRLRIFHLTVLRWTSVVAAPGFLATSAGYIDAQQRQIDPITVVKRIPRSLAAAARASAGGKSPR
jgi:hypothetical protein